MRVSTIRVPAALGFLLCPLFAWAQTAACRATFRQYGRYRVAPHRHRAGAVHDPAGPGAVLRGLVRTKNMLSILMQCFAITCVVSLLWLVVGYGLASPTAAARSASSAGSTRPSCGRVARRADGHGSRNPVLHVPDDLRDHHAGAGHRRLRGAHALLRRAVVHRAVAAARLRADRALGVGRRLARAARRDGFRRRHRGARECRRRGAGVRAGARQAPRLSADARWRRTACR